MIRFGSTNRLADAQTISEIHRLKEFKSYDEQPNFHASLDEINMSLAKEVFLSMGKKLTEAAAKSLGIIVEHQAKNYPSNGGLLLFGNDRKKFFPDSEIRVCRFGGNNCANVIDLLNISSSLPRALEEVMAFIRRNTSTKAVFGELRRKEIPEYIPLVLREAIVNAIVHSDYSIQGASIQIAIFDDRLEITNPGSLPYGLSMESALSGISQLRNKVIGRVFRELGLIEQWGSGFERMIDACVEQEISPPKFEELDRFFRVTIYPRTSPARSTKDWQIPIIKFLQKHKEISAKAAQDLWDVSRRTTTNRLKIMCEQGLLGEVATGSRDPQKVFVLLHRDR